MAGAAPTVVVGLDVADLTEAERRLEVLKLRRTRPDAHGAAPARAGPAPNLRVSHRRASTGRTRQDSDPARRGPGREPLPLRTTSGSSVYRPVGSITGAGGSARVRSVLSPPVPDVAVSSDAPRGPGDQHGHLARLSSRPDRHARRPRTATRHGLGLALNLVPPRPAERLAPPPASRTSGDTHDRALDDSR